MGPSDRQLLNAADRLMLVGHDAMPEFELSPRQIADLIGYLGTLGRR